jgi:hypothetical protein
MNSVARGSKWFQYKIKETYFSKTQKAAFSMALLRANHSYYHGSRLFPPTDRENIQCFPVSSREKEKLF